MKELNLRDGNGAFSRMAHDSYLESLFVIDSREVTKTICRGIRLKG
jgi:hypothetical protein